MYGAYDAFNLTEVTGPIHIANCTVHKGRGLLLLCENMLNFVRIFGEKNSSCYCVSRRVGVGHEAHIFMECVCVCVCVRERERQTDIQRCVCESERDRQTDRGVCVCVCAFKGA